MKDLPPEILFEIFAYLRFEDRKRARLVCKQWNHILLSSQFIRDEVFRYESTYQKFALKHVREYFSVRIRTDFQEEDSLEIFHQVGRSTQLLETTYPHIFPSARKFQALLNCFPDLKSLFLGDSLPSPIFENSRFRFSDRLQHINFHKVPQICKKVTTEVLRNIPLVTADVVHIGTSYSEETSELFDVSPDLFEFLVLNHKLDIRLGSFNLVGDRPVEFGDVVEIDSSHPFYPELAQFSCIETLNISVEEIGTDCFSQHTLIEMRSVRKVSWENGMCLDCLQCLAQSCPNATSWYLHKLDVDIFLLLEDVFENIESLDCRDVANFNEILEKVRGTNRPLFRKIRHLEATLKQESIIDFDLWPPMPRLEELSLYGINFPWENPLVERLVAATPTMRHYLERNLRD